VRLGDRPVVGPISFALPQGRMIAIVGPNGAGKTTLLRAIAGIHAPQAGNVVIAGRPAAAWTSRERARQVALLPQGGVVHWPLTVERVVSLGRVPHLAPWQRLSARHEQVVRRVGEATGILDLFDRPVTTLSMGERSRVLLARALATEAPVLLADEPIASMDPGHQFQVMELLRGSVAAGAAVLVVLHDLSLAGRFCDRLLVLDRGVVAADGPPRSVLTPELLAAVYGVEALTSGDAEPFFVVPTRRSSVGRP
jgi:iron complex transport system ATP-binding protein